MFVKIKKNVETKKKIRHAKIMTIFDLFPSDIVPIDSLKMDSLFT